MSAPPDAEPPRGPIVREPWWKNVGRQVGIWVGSIAAAFVLFVVIQWVRPDPAVHLAADGTAPDFALVATDGSTVHLSDLRGKKVILNFWATWCGPCRLEMPALRSFARAHPDVVLLGIAVDSGSRARLAKEKEAMDLPYPILVGDAATSEAYAVSSLPTTFVVDETGHITTAQVGPVFGWQLAFATR